MNRQKHRPKTYPAQRSKYIFTAWITRIVVYLGWILTIVLIILIIWLNETQNTSHLSVILSILASITTIMFTIPMAILAFLALQASKSRNEPSLPISEKTLGRKSHIQDENIYGNITPRHVDQAVLDRARQKLVQMPRDDLPRIGSLPSGSYMGSHSAYPDFVGRENELRRIADLLEAGGKATVALTGLGGIGKTQVAIEFAHRYGQYYEGGVVWLSFADASAIQTEIAARCKYLERELQLDMRSLRELPSEEQVQLVLSTWMNELPRLLIFDNCQEEHLLKQWRPPIGGCRVLITSCLAEWNHDLGVEVLPLHELSSVESIEFLGRFRPDLSEADRGTIADKLGHFPLALHIAAHYLHDNRESPLGRPEIYLESLRTERLRHASLHHVEKKTYTTDHPMSVHSTFALNYKRLVSSDAIDECALKVLARAAHFAPDTPIPLELLKETMKGSTSIALMSPRPKIGLGLAIRSARASKGIDQTEHVITKAIKRLSDLGLLEKPETKTRRMHRLLAEFVQRQRKTAGPEPQVVVEQVLLKIADQRNNSGSPELLSELQAHLRYVTNAALQRREDKLAANLCYALGFHLSTIGIYSEAQSYLLNAQHIRERLCGLKHPDLAQCFKELGVLHHRQGNYGEAEAYFRKSQAIYETLNSHAIRLHECLNALAGLYCDMGKDELAELLYLKVLRARECELDSKLAEILNDLGTFYVDRHRYDEGEPLLLRAQEMYQKMRGLEHLETSYPLLNLGSLYYEQKKYEQAEPFLLQAWNIRKRILGPDHPEVAICLNFLGMLYQKQGRYKEAEENLQRALEMRQKVLGAEHPDVAQSLSNLGELYTKEGRYEEAKERLQRALNIRLSAFGNGHLSIGYVYRNLTLFYQAQGRDKESEEYAQKALNILQPILGSQDEYVVEMLEILQEYRSPPTV